MSNWLALLCVPLLLVLLVNAESRHPSTRKVTTVILSMVLGLLLLAVPGRPFVSGLVWFSIAESLPILVVIGVIVVGRKRLPGNSLTQRLMLLLCVVATLSLLQFPYANRVYFCFVVPVLILVLLALAEETTAYRHWHSPLLPVLAFYLLFGVFAIRDLYLIHFGNWPKTAFTLPVAAGFLGDKDTVELYERAVPEVLRHAGNAPIYAGPDSPEFYFLTGHRNPTPIYLDFLAGIDAQPQRILNAIDTSGVRTVVINHGGSYWGRYNPSGPPSPELLNGLRERFPQATVIGYFEIRWKS
jgi:hypothetical protein